MSTPKEVIETVFASLTPEEQLVFHEMWVKATIAPEAAKLFTVPGLAEALKDVMQVIYVAGVKTGRASMGGK